MIKFVPAMKMFMHGHKDQLLLATSIVGTASTGISGIRAGIRIERKRQQLLDEKGEVTKKDIAKIVATESVPVLISAGAGIGGSAALYGRVKSAKAAIALLSTQNENMRNAIKDAFGEEKAKEIQEKAVQKTNNELRPANEEVKPTNGYFWFKDSFSGSEFYARKEDVIRAEGNFKEDLVWQDCSVNEFLMYIDKLACNHFYQDCGEYAGWKNGTKFRIDIEHFTTFLNDGTPAIKVVYVPEPRALPKRLLD